MNESSAAHIDVRYVANLARIALTDAEIQRYAAELDDILHYVAQLGELDLDGIEPTAQAFSRVNVMREDDERPTLDRAWVTRNAPVGDAEGRIRVPAVMDEEGH